jgi:hypothetical protein
MWLSRSGRSPTRSRHNAGPLVQSSVGVVGDDYDEWLRILLSEAARVSEHVFLWGFPEIVWRALPRKPSVLNLIAWLTWYFPNCPSVIRGWRSAQMACLHSGKARARLYPEHFLNEAQAN